MGTSERISEFVDKDAGDWVLVDGEQLKNSDIYVLLRTQYSVEGIEKMLPYDVFVGSGLRKRFPDEPFVDTGEKLFRGSSSEHLYRGLTRAAMEVAREHNPELFDARRTFLRTRAQSILADGAQDPLIFPTDKKGFEVLRIHPLPSFNVVKSGPVVLDDKTSTDTETYILTWLPQRLLCELLAHPVLGSPSGLRILHLLRGSDRQHGYIGQGAIINVLWALANVEYEPDRNTSDVWNSAEERRIAFAEFFANIRLVEESIPGSPSVAGLFGRIDSKTYKAFFQEAKGRTS